MMQHTAISTITTTCLRQMMTVVTMLSPGVGKPAGGGHPVNGVIDAGTTPDSARHNHDQDPEHGPGVK